MVSIIVPAFNAELTLAASINSVLQQTCSDWELIISDDGSSDATIAVVEAFNDARIKLIRGAHSGLPAAVRNRALREASGDYLAFLDADDLWEPSKLEKQLKFFAEHPECGLVFTRLRRIDAAGKIISPEPVPDLQGFDNPDDFVAALGRNNMICNSSVMISRAVFETVGEINERSEIRGTEDFDYWLKIARRYSVGYLSSAEVRYRIHEQGLSRNICAMRKGAFLVVSTQLGADSESLHHEAISTRAFQWALAASAMRDREHFSAAVSALEKWPPKADQKLQLWLSRVLPAKLLQKMMFR